MTTERLEALHTALNRLCANAGEQIELTIARNESDAMGACEEEIAYDMMNYMQKVIRARVKM